MSHDAYLFDPFGMAADTRLSNYPTFGSLNPKRKIHIFELRTLAAKSRHGIT
jgi:hypothetical protein